MGTMICFFYTEVIVLVYQHPSNYSQLSTAAPSFLISLLLTVELKCFSQLFGRLYRLLFFFAERSHLWSLNCYFFEWIE